ncbi:hypothetical protein ACHAXA_005756, partial [Cyclostephanos tholiformis]
LWGSERRRGGRPFWTDIDTLATLLLGRKRARGEGFSIMETESTSADRNTPELFVHVRFEVPATASSAGGDGMLDDDDDGTYDAGGLPAESRVAITEQHFDLSNCKTAMIGLPVGLGPVKPEPGDYAYSGMHDHGPLPPPREGGQFADIIGLVRAAKAASDAYLTDLIEREKTSTTTTTQVSAAGGIIKGAKHKRKRP